MRTDRKRYDSYTELLRDNWEPELTKTLADLPKANADGNLPPILKEIMTALTSVQTIRTSKELDSYLQTAMMLVYGLYSLYLEPSRRSGIRLSTSLYQQDHQLFVVKACFFSRARCTVRHPTIPVYGDYESESVGLSGLAWGSGKIVYCTNIQRRDCGYHVPLADEKTAASLAIPLSEDISRVMTDFGRVGGESCCSTEGDLSNWRKVGSQDTRRKGVAVISIEAEAGQDLGRGTVREFIRSKRLQEVLTLLSRRLEEYQKERPQYTVLRACTSLMEIAQHSLDARGAYLAVLAEMSEVMGGAEITLHLRDLFGDEDRQRAIRLVAGVGPRFRGYLIGDRYGHGLVGDTVFEAQKRGTGPRLLDRDDIAETEARDQEGNRDLGYRRLMPGTTLNVAVPLFFFDRPIGALNIEWGDATQMGSWSAKKQRAWVESNDELFRSLARYIAMVVDYFDDMLNPLFEPEAAFSVDAIRSTQGRRLTMAYYVGAALDSIDRARAKSPSPEEPDSSRFLQGIIHAVGYLLSWESRLRILVSLRRAVPSGDNPKILEILGAPHGFGTMDDGHGPSGKIVIDEQETVLTNVAKLGVPIYGRLVGAEDDAGKVVLRLDQMCSDSVPAEVRKRLKKEIPYKPAGPSPRYEVGIPLIFGNQLRGTFDFELFAVPDEVSASGEIEALPIKGYQLHAFLEWARAITLCMAIAEDSMPFVWNPPDDTGSRSKIEKAYRRVQRLCAQIVANVPLDNESVTRMGREQMNRLFSIRRVKVARSLENSFEVDSKGLQARGGSEIASSGRFDGERTSTTKAQKGSHELELWSRGRFMGKMAIDFDLVLREDDRSIFSNDRENSGAERLAGRFLAAFEIATQLAGEPTSTLDDDFGERLAVIESLFLEMATNATNGSYEGFENSDLTKMVRAAFQRLHEALTRAFLGDSPHHESRGFSEGDHRHGWYLYLACVETLTSGREGAVLRCGDPGNRWAAMYTAEMRGHVDHIVESQDQVAAFSLLLEKDAEDLMEQVRSRCNSGQRLNRGDIERFLLEALSRRGYEIPQGTYGQESSGPSVTLRVLKFKRVLPVFDLNRAPYRSARKTEWFFRDSCYSLVGVPINLAGECIGVLHLLRRRDRVHDLKFFKNEEIEAARRLGQAVSKLLDALIQVIRLPKDHVERSLTHSPDLARLGRDIRKMIRDGTPGLISCDFANHRSLVRRLCDEWIRDWPFMMWRNLEVPYSSVAEADSTGADPSVLVIAGGEKLLQEIRTLQDKGTLSDIFREFLVVIFCLPGERNGIWDLIDEFDCRMSSAGLLRREEMEDALLTVMAGMPGGDRKPGAILVRRRGPGCIEDLVEGLGGTTTSIARRLPPLINDIMKSEAPQLFESWYSYRAL